jgi:hypothetical protein
MKAYETIVKVKQDGQLELPEEFKQYLLSGQSIRLIALVAEEEEEEKAWEHFAAQEFLSGYADSDSIYDDYVPPKDKEKVAQ